MLGFKIIKTDGSDSATHFYNKTYLMWKEVWTETYNKLEGVEKINSDQFLINEYCGVITYKNDPIACWLISFFDSSLESYYDRSYLLQYPDKIVKDEIERLSAKKVCLYNNITVSRDFRRQNPDLPCSIAWLQFSLAIKFYQYSNSDVLFGYCRNEKMVNEMAFAHGARKLDSSIRHNVQVDYISIAQKDIKFDVPFDIRKNAETLFKEYLQSQEQEIRQAS